MQGRVAIVTGAGSGLGEATARRFAAEGASVCVADIHDGAERVASSIVDGGGDAMAVRCDVADEPDVRAMVDATVARWGRLDFAYNNAGINQERRPTAEIPVDEWRRLLDVNVTGVWLCMRSELPAMVAGGGGVIVNCSSGAGLRADAAVNLTGYAATKAAVLALTRGVAREYGPQGVRAVAICPGGIETPMLSETMAANPEWAEKMLSGKPLGRLGLAHEIADAVIWACSPQASYVSGHPIVVDGAAYC
ncbi:MAG TPA: glucose 1-dehydrogenase [Acidimicrobiales bacterium]|nr:glucose 1-dehydrogenase [Acidimicrobiales bacterium]